MTENTNSNTSNESSSQPSVAPTDRPSVWKRLRFLPFAILFAAVVVMAAFRLQVDPNPVRFVNALRVTQPSSFSIDASSLVGGNGEYDFYVVIKTHSETTQQLETYPASLIGNGLHWDIKPVLPLADIKELVLYDEDLLGDDQLDRVTVDEQFVTTGQKYEFEFIEDNPVEPAIDARWLWAVISGAGVLAVLTIVAFVRDQAIS